MIVDDFVMLGRTVPEPTSQKILYVCSAGVAPSQGGLIRIFPLTVRDKIPRWSRQRIDLVPHNITPKDNRVETRSLGEHRYQQVAVVAKAARQALLAPYFVGSIAEANERRMSLALLRIGSGWEFRLDRNPGDQAPHREIWGPQPPKAKERFEFTPRLHFTDERGLHKIQIRDWGVFELMRKQGPDISQMDPDEQVAWIGGSLKISDESTLFVGNYANHRTSWCVISILNGVIGT